MNAGTVAAGTDGCTIMSRGERTTCTTGWKSAMKL
jgi:hypothetical protein